MYLMKAKRIISVVLAALMLISAAAVLSACGGSGKKISIVIHDSGKDYKCEGTDDMTVQKLIDESGLTITDKDETEPDRDTKWSEAKADAITIKRYAKVTVVCGDESKTVELKGATVEQAVSAAGFTGYEPDADRTKYLEDGMTITLKKPSKGKVVQNGKTYYYGDNGELLKNTIAGSDAEGYVYVNGEGIVDDKYCGAVNIDGVDWNVINGVPTKVTPESDKTLSAALKAVSEYITSDMTKEQKLKACFDHIKSDYVEKVPRTPPYHESDWAVIYANDILVNGAGDCYSYGAAYAYLAKAIGCDEVYACNSGGHGWAEVEGKVYDPEWSLHHSDYNYCGLSYDDKTDVNYKGGIAPGADWMRIKI